MVNAAVLQQLKHGFKLQVNNSNPLFQTKPHPIFLPLSLLAGWYGMNFTGMPELNWKYGYPVIIAVSVIVVALSLWICRKKKFW
mgnify:FL=1